MSQLSGEILSKISQFGQVYFFDTIDSTQLTTRKLAKAISLNEHYGIQAIVIANQQTKGFGRFGRYWYSPRQGLYFSLLVNLVQDDTPLTLWTLYSAKVIADVLEKVSTVPMHLKWPNDIVFMDSNCDFYKVGGILTETFGRNTFITKSDKRIVIMGIGLNINQTDFPLDLPQATSLKLIRMKTKQINADFNLMEILYDILLTLSDSLISYRHQPKTEILQQIKHKSCVIGKRLKVSRRHKTINGTAIDIDEQGRLILRTEIGRIITIDAGEVFAIQ